MRFNLPHDYDLEAARDDAKKFSIDDWLCRNPKVIEVLIFVLPIAKIFCGRMLKAVLDIFQAKLQSLNCNP